MQKLLLSFKPSGSHIATRTDLRLGALSSVHRQTLALEVCRESSEGTLHTHVGSFFNIDREVRLGPAGESNSFAVSLSHTLSQLLYKPGQSSSPPREAVHEPAHIHIS